MRRRTVARAVGRAGLLRPWRLALFVVAFLVGTTTAAGLGFGLGLALRLGGGASAAGLTFGSGALALFLVGDRAGATGVASGSGGALRLGARAGGFGPVLSGLTIRGLALGLGFLRGLALVVGRAGRIARRCLAVGGLALGLGFLRGLAVGGLTVGGLALGLGFLRGLAVGGFRLAGLAGLVGGLFGGLGRFGVGTAADAFQGLRRGLAVVDLGQRLGVLGGLVTMRHLLGGRRDVLGLLGGQFGGPGLGLDAAGAVEARAAAVGGPRS